MSSCKERLNCGQTRPLLSDYFDGRLPARRAGEVGSHVQRCDPCRAELQALESTARLLQSFANQRPPADFDARLAARLASIDSRNAIGSQRWTSLSWIENQRQTSLPWMRGLQWRWAAAAAVAAGLSIATSQLMPGPAARPVGRAYLQACVQAHQSYSPVEVLAARQSSSSPVQEAGPDLNAAFDAAD